jgi:Recombinase zinc beta ribbon domain
LVTEDQFEKVQKVLAANGHSGIRRRLHHHHLKGLLWCGRCRKRLVVSNVNGNGGAYAYMFYMGRKTRTCDLPHVRTDGRDGIEHAVSPHYATVTLSEDTRTALTAEVDQAIAAEQALSHHVHAQLTKKPAQLEERENALFSLIGHPDWDQPKLNTQMQQVKRDSATARKQLADMSQALDTGRQVFVTALDMLTDTQATYDREPDDVKTLLTKTIFGKLYLDADPDGRVTVTGADLAGPVRRDPPHRPQPTPDPQHARRGQAAAPAPATARGRPHTALRATASHGRPITLSGQQPNKAYGSNKPCLVGVAGFEPTASSSPSNPGGHALIWAKPNRGPLFLTCANAPGGSR